MNALDSSGDVEVHVDWLCSKNGEVETWVDELVSTLERQQPLRLHVRRGRARSELALDEALDARVNTQVEIGRLLEEILRRTGEQHRQRRAQRCGGELEALEDVLDGALDQAEQEDEEIERIIVEMTRWTATRAPRDPRLTQ